MKKVICFVGELNVDFQAELTKSLAAYFGESGHEITFFVNFDTNSVNAMYGDIEKKIMHIPSLNDYDGVIICPDTFAIAGMDEELSDFLEKNAVCPVISVRVRNEHFYNVLLGDYPAVCEMVEHFIVHHGLTRICFMTGRMDLEDAHVRLKAYRDTMAKHGIEVTDKMIFEGDYWREKGEEAVSWFIDDSDEMPQAIVCSNDYMAISVCNALTARKIRIPEDVCVSGLDDIEEISYHLPPITSIRSSPDTIAKKILESFENIWAGNDREKDISIPLEPQYRNSCGCKTGIDYTSFQKLYLEKEEYLSALNFSPYLGLDFESADNIEDLMYSVHHMLTSKNYGSPDDFGTMYFCFCDNDERQENAAEMSISFTESIILEAVISADGVQKCSEKFYRNEILPARYRKSGIPLYILVLHCKDYCYGYIAVQNNDISRFNHLLKTLLFALGNSLDRIRMFSENQLVQDLREQSYIDEMTQIPNRRSMERFIRKLYERLERTEQPFCIMSIDMDGLKYINDTFGHMEGDSAISCTAKVLDALKPDLGLAARTGGDEFVALFPSDNYDDALFYIESINKAIEQYNNVSGKPYELSVSIGYEYCHKGMDMLGCMHQADKRMYESKKAKKKNRI